MRNAKVFVKGIEAGVLTEQDNGSYTFSYLDSYFVDSTLPAASLTLPKNEIQFTSPFLFPFFFSLLSEGANKAAQCRQLKIDENDYFGLLLSTTGSDTVGAVTIKPIE